MTNLHRRRSLDGNKIEWPGAPTPCRGVTLLHSQAGRRTSVVAAAGGQIFVAAKGCYHDIAVNTIRLVYK